MKDFTTRDQVLAVYRRRAPHYDFSANLYRLLGFREAAYRRMAVDALRLNAGDTVVEIGCGTWLNFPLLQAKVGTNGRIIGVDLTDAMLARAAARVASMGWSNVELIQSDAASYRFPEGVNGILSTFALTLEPEYDDVIERGARALSPGGRLVILDMKLPRNWLRHLAPVLVLLVRPFAVSTEITRRHPWESVERHLRNPTFSEVYFGVGYIAAGDAPQPAR